MSMIMKLLVDMIQIKINAIISYVPNQRGVKWLKNLPK